VNILVTGGAGYVGSVLIPSLIKEGHNVKCLDRFFFGNDFLKNKKFNDKLELIQDDIRWFEPKILNDVDVVMDLAALSNDPVGELNLEKTFEINHKGRVRVARLSKDAGVPKYILASSASIYGQQKQIADETSAVFPLTAYSKANHAAEIDVLKLDDDNFSVTVLRFSSIYGVSPRMRFDISVNNMVLELFKNKKIIVRGKSNRRPFLHIKDAGKAYHLILNAPKEKISGQIFNVGSDEQNYEIAHLAKEIINSLGVSCELELGDTKDFRSYIASFKKIKDAVGFTPQFNLADGAKEIFEDLKTGKITDSMKTITVKWYKHLQSNSDLFPHLIINGKIL